MMNSTHKVEVVPVSLRIHNNADSLSIVDVFGYTVVVRTADWEGIHLGAYFPPDSVVDVSRPEFAFLASGTKTKHRICAKKLRGVQSFGLLLPAPDGAKAGDDLAEYYGVEHYEPEMKGVCSGGEMEPPPSHLAHLSKFDIDALRRYSEVFRPGEMVLVTEKIHGANSRFCYWEGRMWAGSRTEWKKPDVNNLWWKVLAATPSLERFCRENPGWVVYGETYGQVQSLKYGTGPGEVRFAAFDLWKPEGGWLDAGGVRNKLAGTGVPQVPFLYFGRFDFQWICDLAEGPSAVLGADHVREGCVVKPLEERWDDRIGRVCLKVVGAGYLEKDNG